MGPFGLSVFYCCEDDFKCICCAQGDWFGEGDIVGESFRSFGQCV